MDSNDEEEHEGRKEETRCSLEHLNVEPSTFKEEFKKKEWKESMISIHHAKLCMANYA